MDYLYIETNKGQVLEVGGDGGTGVFKFPEGRIRALTGGYHHHLDNLGVKYDPRSRLNFDWDLKQALPAK